MFEEIPHGSGRSGGLTKCFVFGDVSGIGLIRGPYIVFAFNLFLEVQIEVYSVYNRGYPLTDF